MPDRLGAAFTFEQQAEVILSERPPVFSFTFGIAPPALMRACRDAGIVTIGTANSAADAVQLVEAGCDAIIAQVGLPVVVRVILYVLSTRVYVFYPQGIEAGGHRGGGFAGAAAGAHGPANELSLPVLLKEIRAVFDAGSVPRVPVIAAGGIMDAEAVLAALQLGASGVAAGTAFLATTEAAASASVKRLVSSSSSVSGARGGPVGVVPTHVTDAYSGRRARLIDYASLPEAQATSHSVADTLMSTVAAVGGPLPATAPLRRAAAAAGVAGLESMYAGMGAGYARPGSASDVVAHLMSGWAALGGAT
jgi:nitronate monooxygenase